MSYQAGITTAPLYKSHFLKRKENGSPKMHQHDFSAEDFPPIQKPNPHQQLPSSSIEPPVTHARRVPLDEQENYVTLPTTSLRRTASLSRDADRISRLSKASRFRRQSSITDHHQHHNQQQQQQQQRPSTAPSLGTHQLVGSSLTRSSSINNPACDHPTNNGDDELRRKSYRALELDYMMIRQTLKTLQDRVKLQEEIQHDLFPDELEKFHAKHAEEEKLQQEWLSSLSEGNSNEETEQRRVKMEEALSKVIAQVDSMEKRLSSSSELPLDTSPSPYLHQKEWQAVIISNAKRAAVHPLTIIILGCVVMVTVFYIHMVYFDEEEQALRRTLGPDYYRSGWREYSMRVF